MGVRRRAAVAGLALAALAAAGAWAAAAWVPLPERLCAPGSTAVLYRDGGPAWVELAPDERWRLPVAVEDVDPAYVSALLRLEDKRFRAHPGVDPIALARAIGQNLGAGRVVSGASTLTMQLVRVVEPRPRTLTSKGVEGLRAAQLEARLSKDEILAAYLTFTPFGRNIEGVEAAAWAYFGHSARHLDAVEIATLLAVPQSPNWRYPSPENAERLRVARDAIADRLLVEGAMPVGEGAARRAPEDVLAQVKAAPVPTALRPVPRDVAHAAAWLRGHQRDPELPTTLDRGVQARAEAIVAAQRQELAARGIRHVAVVVVDHADAEIRALIGGFDFWEGTTGAQIPAFTVARSPGSTLKPLIYARAIDQGLALPERLLPDIPVRYGTYAPDNYDGSYDGVVRLEDALSRSLNVPFVNLLGDVGVEPFLADLRAMGARSLNGRPGHYGLSAAVGGIELSPLDLASVYATLARQGRHAPLTLTPRASAPRERVVYAPGAAFLTGRALQLKDRPDFPDRHLISSAPRRIQWKTGTSFGNRDAWAVGSGRRYTVVVWLGNLDQTPSSHLIGASAAGPILFDLLEALDDGATGPEPAPPADLIEVEVCALSGHLPTDACPHRAKALALQTRVPTGTCPYHVGVEVEVATGQAVSPDCRAGRETRVESFVLWPAAVRRWLHDRHRWQPSPPVLAAGCAPIAAGGGPRILSPGPDEVFLLLPGVAAADQEIPLEAESGRADAALHWYVGGAWIGTARAEERLWWAPAPGVHDVVVMDDLGRTHTARLDVRDGRVARAAR